MLLTSVWRTKLPRAGQTTLSEAYDLRRFLGMQIVDMTDNIHNSQEDNGLNALVATAFH